MHEFERTLSLISEVEQTIALQPSELWHKKEEQIPKENCTVGRWGFVPQRMWSGGFDETLLTALSCLSGSRAR